MKFQFSLRYFANVIRHPVLRSTLLLGFSLLIGMTSMTWFATNFMSRQSTINHRVQSIIKLKNLIDTHPQWTTRQSDFSAFHGKSNESTQGIFEDAKELYQNLDCFFGFVPTNKDCPFTELFQLFKQNVEYRSLQKQWKQLVHQKNGGQAISSAFFASNEMMGFLLNVEQLLSVQLEKLFRESVDNQGKFRTITIWVWILGVILLTALMIGHAAPVLNYTQQLEIKQNQLHQMFQNTPAGIVRITPDGKILGANPAAQKILSPANEEPVIGKYFQQFLLPAYQELFYEWLQEISSHHQEIHKMVELQSTNGETRFLEIYLSGDTQRNHSGDLQISFIDITEKKRTEDRIKKYLQALEEKFSQQVKRVRSAETRYKNLFENTPAGMFLYNSDGQIIQANSVARRFFQSIEWNIEDHVYHQVWGSELLLTNLLQRAKDGSRLHGEEIRIHCPDGTERYLTVFLEPFPLEWDQQPVYLCTFFDITSHIQTEKKLQRLTNYFQTIFNNTTDGIIVYDKNNTIADVNERLCELSGFSREELLGRGCFHLFCQLDDPQKDHDCILDQVKNGNIITTQTVELKRKNGETWIAEVDGSLLYDEDGHFIGTIQILRDITEKVAAERQQKILEEQLQQAQKMEIIGQLAGGVAHDFNNILTAIKGFADFALMVLPPKHPAQSYIHKIVEGADSAARLTSQLLSFSRRKVLKLEPLNLNDVVYQSMDFVQRTLGEKIQIEIKTTRENTIVKLDKTAIQQILTNLCVNARDAMPDGGKLKITTAIRNISEDYPLLPPELSPGTYVMLSISDTGMGIPKEIQDRIFEPFFTTKKPGKGTGLGLSMVYGLVKQQNGFITVYSERGKGTEFKIFFPLSDEAPASNLKETRRRGNLQGTGTILVAEDEPLVLEVLESTLNQYGYQVKRATNGREAWEIFQKHRQEISLVIFDAIMPEVSGDELMERIRQVSPETPLICISGYSEEGIHQNYILKEGLDYLEKPFSPEALLKKVKNILKK